MIKSEFKKVLWEIFDVLGFFEHEKEKALEGFKRKFAGELLREMETSFTDDQRQWLDQVMTAGEYDKNHPRVAEIQKAIDFSYPPDKLEELSRQVFKRILASYVDFMSQKVDSEKGEKIKQIAESF